MRHLPGSLRQLTLLHLWRSGVGQGLLHWPHPHSHRFHCCHLKCAQGGLLQRLLFRWLAGCAASQTTACGPRGPL